MKILNLNQHVLIGNVVPSKRDLDGCIKAVCIREGGVTYEVAFWVNSEYKAVWLREEDFSSSEEKKYTSVGFIN
jgi:hypothetical protein